MNIEREIVISVLKLSRSGPVSHELINKDAKVPLRGSTKLLERLQNIGLIYVHKGVVEADSMQRLRLAIHALGLGADLERVSLFLRWQEFEGITSIALERNGYEVRKNLRFTHKGRKWEIDVVGCKEPLVVCIDCKRWQHGMHLSALTKSVQEQVQRVKALAESLPIPAIKIPCVSWGESKFIPVVLSLVTTRSRFLEGVPIVQVLQLQDFLNQLPAYADSLTHFDVSSRHGQDRFP